jgi:hypothetical protein
MYSREKSSGLNLSRKWFEIDGFDRKELTYKKES